MTDHTTPPPKPQQENPQMSCLVAPLHTTEGDLPVPYWARFRPQKQDVICGPDWDDPSTLEIWAVVRAVADSFAEVNSGLTPDADQARCEDGHDVTFSLPIPSGLVVPSCFVDQGNA